MSTLNSNAFILLFGNATVNANGIFTGGTGGTLSTLSSDEQSYILSLIQDSNTLAQQLNDFANAGGQIKLNDPYNPGEFFNYIGSDTGGPLINLQVSLANSTDGFVNNPFYGILDGQAQGGQYDTIGAAIIGLLAHELGHFENSPANPNKLSGTQIPVGIYTMPNEANPAFGAQPTAVSQAQLVADELLSEGIAVYNNLEVAKEIAITSSGNEQILFDMSLSNLTQFEQKLLGESTAQAITDAANAMAMQAPSTAPNTNYLQNEWENYSPAMIELSETLTDVKGINISTDSTTGLAKGMTLGHVNSDGTAYLYYSNITFDSTDPTAAKNVTDTWVNPSNNKIAVQTIDEPASGAFVYTDTIYQDSYEFLNAPLTSVETASGMLQYSVGATGAQEWTLANIPGTTILIDYKPETFAGDQTKVVIDSNGTFGINTTVGNGDVLEVLSVTQMTGVEENFSFAGATGTLTLDSSAQGTPANNYVLDASSTASANVNTDTISFAGHSIAGSNLTSGSADQYGRSYTLNNGTLTITSGSDSLTINNFANGKFGVDFAPKVTVPGAQTVVQDTLANISGVSVSSSDASTDIITATVSDTNGTLNANSNGANGGGTITGNDTNQLTVSGTLAQVNADLILRFFRIRFLLCSYPCSETQQSANRFLVHAALQTCEDKNHKMRLSLRHYYKAPLKAAWPSP